MKCSFCNSDEIANRIILQDAYCMVFPTNMPIVPGHLLICPVRCAPDFQSLNMNERDSIFKAMSFLETALRSVFEAEGFNYAWNQGASAGQTVPHFHLHMVPRKQGDVGVLEYEPRKFLYRPGPRSISPDQELIEVARSIRAALPL